MEQVIEGCRRHGRFRFGPLLLAVLAAGCAQVPDMDQPPDAMGNRPTTSAFIQPTAEAALGDAGIGTFWVAPNGDRSDKTYSAAVDTCKLEIQAASTDQIHSIPFVDIKACLLRKGWKQIVTKK